jgi:hypothetical protein
LISKLIYLNSIGKVKEKKEDDPSSEFSGKRLTTMMWILTQLLEKDRRRR